VNDLERAHSIISRFLSEEATPHVRKLLSESIAEAATDPKIERREFNLNAFDVEFDFKEERVVIADVLSSEAGIAMSLVDFAAALGS